MSVVKVQGNASGTGIFTIAAPATNTDRTLTLPDQTGTVLTNAGPFTANASASNGAVTIDASNNVGIGTSSPAEKFVVSNGGANGVELVPTISSGTESRIQSYNRSGAAYTPLSFDGQIQKFLTGGSERARIDSSGNLLVGATSAGYTSSRFVLSLDNSTKWVTGPGAGIATRFYVSADTNGGVYLSSTSATSWTAISDERHKTDLVPIADGLNKVCSLRAVTGRLTTDAPGTSKAFLIAQDVLSVLPEAVDTSDPDRYGLSYTDTIPLLVKAIQEQQALIESLTARIVALEAK